MGLHRLMGQPETKVALVTGGGSGIGRAVAIGLRRAGFAVAIAGRREEPLRETVGLEGGAVEPWLVAPTNVVDETQVDRLFESIESRWGRLDFFFNNAGVVSSANPLEAFSIQEWRRVIDVNLTGSFLCLQGAYRLMKKQTPQGGRILNNGSVSAQVPRPHAIAYNASKTAITGLTKSAALEGRAYNIAVGQIDIGNARSAMTARMSGGVLQADGAKRPETTMDVKAVVDAIVHMARAPLEANFLSTTLMANEMPFVGRG